MLRNYLKIAWRSLLKNRLFTALNCFGLAIGLAVALTLLLYAKNELAFDRFHAHADRIYRINLTVSFDGKSERWGNAPNVVGPTMKQELPDVENQVRLLRHNFGQLAFVNSATQKLTETKLYWADSTLLNMFDVPLLLGNPATALNGPNRILLSQSAARRYFGAKNPLGQVLDVDNTLHLQVTGIYADLPATSSLDADLIGSFASIKWASNSTNQSWSNASFETYLLLHPQTNVARLERQMEAIVVKNVPKANRFYTLWLQPLPDIHLHSAGITNTSTTRTGDSRQVAILLALAGVVLLIAAINYMNLATAQAQVRAKEVGITKAMGATRPQLVGRFYAETALVTVGALGMGLILLAVGLPFFNQLADSHLSFGALYAPDVVLGLLGLGVGITLLAGAYPAAQLSAFSAKHLLNTNLRRGRGAGGLRQSLVVVQFTASFVLMVSTVIFYRQLGYIQQRRLGYEPTQVMAIATNGAENGGQIEALKNSLRTLTNVVSVCRAQTYPGQGGSGRTLSKPGGSTIGTPITTNRVESSFIQTLGLRLIAGTTLPATRDKPDTDAEADTTIQVVLNKTAVSFLGYTPGQAIGKIAPGVFGNSARIVGVVDDFHFLSLHQPIGPYAFHNANTEGRPFTLIKLRTQNLPETMRQVETVFRQSLLHSAFEFTFLDQFLNSLYQSEQHTARVVLVFAGIAILIACLGLFGLATFMAEQRTKEIGVRKVLGATVTSLVMLLSTDFLKLVVIAILIASPLAWYAMHQWLQDFAYRITIEWWVFAGAGLLAVGIALLTVSFQSIRAALMNPVESLRSE